MIRIKVIPLNKMIARIEISLLYVSLLLVLFLFLSLLIEKYLGAEEKMVFHQEKLLKEEVIVEEPVSDPTSMPQDDLEEMKKETGQIAIEEQQIVTSQIKENSEQTTEVVLEPVYQYEKPKEFVAKEIDHGKLMVGNTIIKNKSKIALDLNELKKPSMFAFKDNTSFLLYHTHTTESYEIKKELYTDNYRTQNAEYNMLKIGETLKKYLEEKGFACDQERTVHDFPNYNGAYKASLQTIQNAMKNTHYDIYIDLHRDAISSTSHYRLNKVISGENVAQLMFVMGTNGSGVTHDHWMDNLKLAIMIQNQAEEMYPGLFRELTLTNSRYNQHISTGALLIEVGGTGNTIEEAENAMKYLANVIGSLKQSE